MTDTVNLTELEKRILELEAEDLPAGPKANAIFDRFDGMSWVRYYHLLDELLDKRAALEHNPVLVNRLRRLRERGMARRGVRGG